MSTVSYDRTQVLALCNELRIYEMKVSQTQAWELIRHVGYSDLVVDAMLLRPRPEWLTEMVGPVK